MTVKLWEESTACNFKMDLGKTNKINHFVEIFYHLKTNNANFKCNISKYFYSSLLWALKINITLLHLPCSWPLHYSSIHMTISSQWIKLLLNWHQICASSFSIWKMFEPRNCQIVKMMFFSWELTSTTLSPELIKCVDRIRF